MTDADAYRKDSRARWGEQAKGWSARAEDLGRATMPVSVWMVDALELQPGYEVLELAAGTGEVGFLAAEQIAPGGTLISSDFVPEMITAAQQRAEQMGITNVRFRQIDAEAIDQPAASLDVVLCRWGYMLMADGEAALRDTRRVLRPGGRLALAAWAEPEVNPWSVLLVEELIARGHAEPTPPGPGQFAWAPEGVVAENLEVAGFVDYEVAAVDFAMRYPSARGWWDEQAAMSMRLRDAAARMGRDEIDEVVAALEQRAAPWTQDDGSLALPARTWVAAATG
jgi:SAM-dependent methyltransferase